MPPGIQFHQGNFPTAGIAQRIVNEKVEYMTVTVIPLEANQTPYPMVVEVYHAQEKNLKQVFSHEKYWDKVFRNHTPVIPPQYR